MKKYRILKRKNTSRYIDHKVYPFEYVIQIRYKYWPRWMFYDCWYSYGQALYKAIEYIEKDKNIEEERNFKSVVVSDDRELRIIAEFRKGK